MSKGLTELTNFVVKFVSFVLPATGWFFITVAALSAIGALLSAVTSNVPAALGYLILALLLGLGGRWILRKKAWLLGLYVAGVEKQLPKNEALERKIIEVTRGWKDKRERHSLFVSNISERSRIEPLAVNVLGGTGWEFLSNRDFSFSFDNEFIYLSDKKTLVEESISLNELVNVEISGPGTVTRGGGFSGGGFGVEGFVQGAVAATLLNVLTTRSSTKTVIRIDLQGSEIFLLNSELEPDEMRVRLSNLFMLRGRSRMTGVAESSDISLTLANLAELRNKGVLSEQEFADAKRKVLG